MFGAVKSQKKLACLFWPLVMFFMKIWQPCLFVCTFSHRTKKQKFLLLMVNIADRILSVQELPYYFDCPTITLVE